MTLQSSVRPDGIAHHHRAMGGWTTTWKDGPPSDWDEIRDRLRSLHPAKAERGKAQRRAEPPVAAHTQTSAAQPVPPPVSMPLSFSMDALRGSQPARVSWRRADPALPGALAGLIAWLRATITATPVVRWWREHDPLLVQRVLLVVNVLLVLLLILQLL